MELQRFLVHHRTRAHALELPRRGVRELVVTPLRLALGYVSELDALHAGVVGVTSVAELEEIFEATRRPLERRPDWRALACNDDELTNPARWPGNLR